MTSMPVTSSLVYTSIHHELAPSPTRKLGWNVPPVPTLIVAAESFQCHGGLVHTGSNTPSFTVYVPGVAGAVHAQVNSDVCPLPMATFDQNFWPPGAGTRIPAALNTSMSAMPFDMEPPTFVNAAVIVAVPPADTVADDTLATDVNAGLATTSCPALLTHLYCVVQLALNTPSLMV